MNRQRSQLRPRPLVATIGGRALKRRKSKVLSDAVPVSPAHRRAPSFALRSSRWRWPQPTDLQIYAVFSRMLLGAADLPDAIGPHARSDLAVAR
jgi:hypothetical protein